VTSDKAYSNEQRLGHIINAIGPIQPGTGGGGNGQRLTAVMTANHTINSTTDIVIGSNSVPLSITIPTAGVWRVKGVVSWNQNASNGVTQAMGLTGPSTSAVRVPHANYLLTSGLGAGANSPGDFTTLAGGVLTPAFAAGSSCYWWFDGVVNFTGTGTFSAVAHCNTTNTFVALSYSYIEAETVGQTS
jgi:hypothetical protein